MNGSEEREGEKDTNFIHIANS